MRIKFEKFKFLILSVFLITGVSISGWALASHFDNKGKSVESQKELKNDIQAANVTPLALDHKNIILVLVCAGLVGIFGVRRQSKRLENFVRGGVAEANKSKRNVPDFGSSSRRA